MTARRILVTGAPGFLGRRVALALAARGHHVVAHGRSSGALAPLAPRVAALAPWDLTSSGPPPEFGALDAVVHCAGLSSNWGARAAFEAANVEGTRRLLRAAARAAPHIVHVSSSSVCFALRDQRGVRESDPLPEPINDYARSKVAAETLVRAWREGPTTILRPRGIYGRGDAALLPRLLRAAGRGPLPLFRGGATTIDLTEVGDVVAAILAVLDARERAAGKTYNVSGGEPVTVRRIIEGAAARAGVTVRWRPTPWPLAHLALRGLEAYHRAFKPAEEPVATVYSAGLLAFHQSLDLSAITRDLGWRPAISFAQGLERAFAGAEPEGPI